MKPTLLVSTMSGKLVGMKAINTNPLNNPFCLAQLTEICTHCYAIRAITSYRQTCSEPWSSNSELLSSGPLEFIPYIETAHARFNAYGELINSQHFHNLMAIARKNQQTTFALWTKRPDLVYLPAVPENVRLVYSEGGIDSPEPIPPGFHLSYGVTHDGKKATCKGHCVDCLMCWKAEGRRIVVKLH